MLTMEPRLTLSDSHIQEVTEAQDADELIRSHFAQFLDMMDGTGRALGMQAKDRHRYTRLMAALRDTLDDEFPMPRIVGDDPWA